MERRYPNSLRTTPNCLIIGCGGHGRVVLDILRNRGRFNVTGFVDSNRSLIGRRIDGIKVLGHPDDICRIMSQHRAPYGVVAIGDNGVRREIAEKVQAQGLTLINAVHPSANIAGNVILGTNTVVAAGALVCAHCQIGDSVILNTGCIVDHETLIGTATHICPGARLAGRVTVESGAFIGIGATVIQSLRIGCEAIVGAGAVVINDVEPMSTVVGVPAYCIKGQQESNRKAWLLPELAKAEELAGSGAATTTQATKSTKPLTPVTH